MKFASLAICASLAMPGIVQARADMAPDTGSDVASATGPNDAASAATDGKAFALGQIVVTATAPQGPQIGSETLTAAAMRAFARVTLDDAVNLLPGVTGGNSGGTRNERLIFVRGFDRFQVPLSIDGIRVYLPADNRLDFGRFLTTDIAQVQVAKGYASVLNGPGAMGGAINLVTSRPTRAFEGRPVASSTLATRANMAAIRSMPGWGRRTRNGMRKPPSRAISPITGIWRAAIAPSPDRPSPKGTVPFRAAATGA
jgi:outer membrane cobalamin receptor